MLRDGRGQSLCSSVRKWEVVCNFGKFDVVTVFDENGTTLYSFGSRGSGNGQFESALGKPPHIMEMSWRYLFPMTCTTGCRYLERRGISKENFTWLMEIRVELQLMIMVLCMLPTGLIVYRVLTERYLLRSISGIP